MLKSLSRESWAHCWRQFRSPSFPVDAERGGDIPINSLCLVLPECLLFNYSYALFFFKVPIVSTSKWENYNWYKIGMVQTIRLQGQVSLTVYLYCLYCLEICIAVLVMWDKWVVLPLWFQRKRNASAKKSHNFLFPMCSKMDILLQTDACQALSRFWDSAIQVSSCV